MLRYEIPNFTEGFLGMISARGKSIRSKVYEFEALGYTFKGLVRRSCSFCIRIFILHVMRQQVYQLHLVMFLSAVLLEKLNCIA